MPFAQFLSQQLLDVIEWNHPEPGILAYRHPMLGQDIQNGGQLTVRDSQIAVVVANGRIADVFGPGLHTLSTPNLPLLSGLNRWDNAFRSPFQADIYFLSTRLQIDRAWRTTTPITLNDKTFGSVRLRGYGVYTYHLTDPAQFLIQVDTAAGVYSHADLEAHLRKTILAGMTDIFAASSKSFFDITADQPAFAGRVTTQLVPAFAALGLTLEQFIVESISLADQL